MSMEAQKNTCLHQSIEAALSLDLEEWRQKGLERAVRNLSSSQEPEVLLNGRTALNFSSNNYLNLANHPKVIEALHRSSSQYGVGSGASRLVCGSMTPHHELEKTVAEWKQAPACLTFSSGYATATGTIPALAGSGDFVILDKLSHACLIDGARLSGATLRVFPHNQLDRLERILQWANEKRSSSENNSRILIVTESVFSMDGDLAPLKKIVELKNKYGAWLMVDEAHATGILGPQGAGCIAAAGLQQDVEVQMGTFSKGLGGAGGFIAGSQPLIKWLIHRARSFVFSTGIPPALAAATMAAIQIARSEEGEQRRIQLQENILKMKELLDSFTLPIADSTDDNEVGPTENLHHIPILPWIVGESQTATLIASRLLDEFQILAPAIRYPTVPQGAARIRFTVSSDHTTEHFNRLEQALQCISTAQDPRPGR